MYGRIVFATLLTWCLHVSGNIVSAETPAEPSEAAQHGVQGASLSDRSLAAPPRALNTKDFALAHPLSNGAFDFRITEPSTNDGFKLTARSSQLFVSEYEGVGNEETAGAESQELSAPSRRSTQQLGPGLTPGEPFAVNDFRGTSPGNGLFKALGVGMFVAAGGDLASTEFGLSQPGVVELNPTQQNRAMRIGTHVAVPALMWWMTEKTHNSGKEKLALIMRIGFTVAYSYAVMHNLRTVSSLP